MQGRRDHRMKLICPVIPIRCGKLQNNPHICILFHHSVSIIPNIPLLLHVILSVPCHSERPSVILSDSEESVTSNRLFTQILHFVQDDKAELWSQILHSACGSVQDDKGIAPFPWLTRKKRTAHIQWTVLVIITIG